MTLRRLVAVAIALSALPLAAKAQSAAQSNLHSLYVSVVDDAGAPVPGLGPSDFMVREDNTVREVLRVGPAEEPMTVAVLVDTSRTARNDISYMRTALPPFVSTLTAANEAGRHNEVAIIGFGERPTILADYSIEPKLLQKGIDRIWTTSSSGPYFLDAISETSQGFKKREVSRPVIVAIVAEGEELSYRSHEEVIERLLAARAPLYVLMLGTPYSGLSDESRNRQMVLDRGVELSGGAREQLLAAMALDARLKLLANQLTHQYLVTYSRPESLIPPEKVTVAATKPGLKARGAPAAAPKAAR